VRGQDEVGTSFLPRVIAGVTGWVAGLYYQVDREGPPVPPGPVLVTANHPNALIDPLMIFRASGRPVRPLAKAPLFEMQLLGTILRGLGGLPVYRRQDDPNLTGLNDTTFEAAIAALRRGEAVQIFPEGTSHSQPSLAPLRTGAARIALLAEQSAGWKLGLEVVPLGLTYFRKHRFRGKVVARVGNSFGVSQYQDAFVQDPQEAVRRLTDEITSRLEEVTLSVGTEEDRELIEVAERLYVREKGWVGWRERERPGERLPRLQEFARGLAWLQANDPHRRDELARDVERYQRLLALFGAKEGDVPPRYRASEVVSYGVRRTLGLVLLALPAAIGVVAWWLPYVIPGSVATMVRPTLDSASTYKLATALIAFPVVWIASITVAGVTLGARWALLAAVLLPLCGWAAVAFEGRRRRFREDLRVFLRASRTKEGRDRLQEARAALTREFDAVADEMERA
jgi:glycerol-3-phosphate O-acyltransferase/dihydroxyacetone phosphate acyltransferase